MKFLSHKTFKVALLAVASIILVNGCATLSESECKTANWQIIGLEDGSKGRATSYIGQHREACSEYTISPDLAAYLKGHSAGLKQFCTEQNGYQHGLRGQALSSVCVGELATNFARGHREGHRIYAAGAELRAAQSQVDSFYHRLDEIERVTKLSEDELVRNGTPEYRRRELLEEIKQLERESESILIELDHLKPEVQRLSERYQRMLGQ